MTKETSQYEARLTQQVPSALYKQSQHAEEIMLLGGPYDSEWSSIENCKSIQFRSADDVCINVRKYTISIRNILKARPVFLKCIGIRINYSFGEKDIAIV